MTGTVLRNATLANGDVAHVRIEGDMVVDVGLQVAPQEHDEVVDLTDHLLVGAAVEPHAHLDKAFLAERIDNPSGDLLGAITAMQAHRHLLDVPETIERAERAARLMAANGYVAVRTHADTTVEHGLRSIEALTEVRERVADVIDVEIVALCGWPVTGAAGADQRALLRDAMAMGADLVGGCPHLEDDGPAATETLLAIAEDLGAGVDLHTDETLDPDACGLTDLARAVLDGFRGPATASHCVSLGQQSIERQCEVAELVAEADVGIVALPHTNLYLQGRGRCPVPRGLTAVQQLHAAGVTVAAGADNLQDPFNPLGRACPFETAALMVLAAHLQPLDAWASVTSSAGRVLGRPPAGPVVGARADLLAVPAATPREAIAVAPAHRLRWRAGVLSGDRPNGAWPVNP